MQLSRRSVAFLWEDGGPLVLVEAGEINDRGEISVNASDANGNNHVVLLIPCDDDHPDVHGCDYDTNRRRDRSGTKHGASLRSETEEAGHGLPGTDVGTLAKAQFCSNALRSVPEQTI